MTTVEDIAGEVERPVTDVLAACVDLDIVASGAHSGLSADEHRRLRVALGARGDLPPVRVGSQNRDPDRLPDPDHRSLRERHDAIDAEAARRAPKRWDIKTATRVAIGSFLLVAVAVAVVALDGRVDDPVSVYGFTSDDVGACLHLGGPGERVLAEVDCDTPHDAELAGIVAVAEDGLPRPDPGVEIDDEDEDPDESTTTTIPFPGRATLFTQAEPACEDAFARHVGATATDSPWSIVLIVPTATTWDAGDRAILCLVEDPSGPLTGSVTDRG